MTHGSEQQTTATVPANAGAGRALKLLGAVVVLVGLPLLVQWAFDFTKDRDANRFAIVGVAIVLGVLGVFALFWVMDQIVARLPRGWRETAAVRLRGPRAGGPVRVPHLPGGEPALAVLQGPSRIHPGRAR